MFSRTYVEPFGGGFGIGIRLLFERKVDHVIYNDADTHLYNLWYSILNFPDQLCALISNSPVTIEERIQQKKIYNNPIHTIIDDGFATLFLNRVNYSGVIKGGPIGGTKQTGNYKLDCRFRRTDLINTIQKISKLKNSIKLWNKDAMKFMRDSVLRHPSTMFVNIDPPYVVKGHELYTEYYKGNLPHHDLGSFVINKMTNIPWLITYDNADIIKTIYNGCNMKEYEIVHNAGGSRTGQEIVISNYRLDKW